MSGRQRKHHGTGVVESDEYPYNDDLLFREETRVEVRRLYPQYADVLDHPQLRAVFALPNQRADDAKRIAQASGFYAVVGAGVSLFAGALAPWWSELPKPWPIYLSILSAIVGLLALLVAGCGLIHGTRKSEWLQARLFTERLRQFHFQTFLWKLADVVAAGKSTDATRRFLEARGVLLDAFVRSQQVKTDQELTKLVDPSAHCAAWLVEVPRDRDVPHVPDGVCLESYFRAYRRLRLLEQKSYAERALRRHNLPAAIADEKQGRRRKWYPGEQLSPAQKKSLLDRAWFVSLVILIMLHVLVIALQLVPLFVDGLHPPKWFESSAHMAIVACALSAVMSKTLAEGMALTKETHRYTEYLSTVNRLMTSFDETSSSHRRLEIMVEMEVAAFEEMRAFLRAHHEASWIM